MENDIRKYYEGWNKMKHKVGDKVRIRTDLKNNVEYDEVDVNEEMISWGGEEVTISEVLAEDSGYEIEEIESLHKDCHGNFRISFDNNFGYDESLVKAPITKDGKPIGVITDVTPEKVEGFIWERYMPIVAELNHNQKPVSFEIVY